ncbi:hypothetical protein M426DRAFT_91269 [Hypoxylon sp. CI-4A]|nr:hypothetical protein M426DRAFT_91269 [Hypoxylon sp. CI-4A]
MKINCGIAIFCGRSQEKNEHHLGRYLFFTSARYLYHIELHVLVSSLLVFFFSFTCLGSQVCKIKVITFNQ